MNILDLDFWVPRIYDQPKNFTEQLGNLIEETLYFGGKKIHINSFGHVYENHEVRLLWNVALKVGALFAAFLTNGIFLTVILGVKCLYRNMYVFEIESSKKKNEPQNTPKPSWLDELKKTGDAYKRANIINSNQIAKVRLREGYYVKKYIFSIGKMNSLKIQQVVKTLGRGGFGVIYELVNLETNEHTALKVAKPSKSSKGYHGYNSKDMDHAIHDLSNEFKNLTFLNSEGKQIGIQTGPVSPIFNMVNIGVKGSMGAKKYKAFEEEQYSMSLDKLKVHTLPLETRFKIIYQIIKGTHYYRRQGLVHSDLKPNNILCKNLEGNWIVDISDFGSAWGQDDDDGKNAYTPAYTTQHDITAVTNSLTKAGRHWSGKKQDIYSLGLTLIELLTGHRLDENSIPKATNVLLRAGLKEGAHKELILILKRMLSKQEGVVIDVMKNWIGDQSVRPSIEEVLSVVSKVL